MTTAPYPPLVSLAEMPLHSGRSDKIGFACQIRSADVLEVAFDWRCLDCAQAAVGYVDAGQDVDVDWRWRSNDGVDHGPVKLSWMAARSMHWLRAAA